MKHPDTHLPRGREQHVAGGVQRGSQGRHPSACAACSKNESVCTPHRVCMAQTAVHRGHSCNGPVLFGSVYVHEKMQALCMRCLCLQCSHPEWPFRVARGTSVSAMSAAPATQRCPVIQATPGKKRRLSDGAGRKLDNIREGR
eukprot:178031-Pelagomonas_calceolata.AAC.6